MIRQICGEYELYVFKCQITVLVTPPADQGAGLPQDSQLWGLPLLTTSSLNLPETYVSEIVFACFIIILLPKQ